MAEFDFDWTGEDPAFKIENELQSISSVGNNEYHIIIPTQSPFFWESLIVQHFNAGNWNTLVSGVDFTPGHLFTQATRQTTNPIYGSYVLTNKALTGAIRHTYQFLGGSWSLDIDKINEILSNKVINPRRTTWEQVADYPEQFPPIPHVHIDEEDMTGMAEVVVSIDNLTDAVIELLEATQAATDPSKYKQSIGVAVGTETDPIELNANATTFVWQTEFILDKVSASLSIAQATGDPVQFDLVVNGNSILDTLITIENTELSSLTASQQPVLNLINNRLHAGDIITIQITQVGEDTVAAGAKVYFVGYPYVA